MVKYDSAEFANSYSQWELSEIILTKYPLITKSRGVGFTLTARKKKFGIRSIWKM